MEKVPIHYQHVHYHHYQSARAHRQAEGGTHGGQASLINSSKNKGHYDPDLFSSCCCPERCKSVTVEEIVHVTLPKKQRWKEQPLLIRSLNDGPTQRMPLLRSHIRS